MREFSLSPAKTLLRVRTYVNQTKWTEKKSPLQLFLTFCIFPLSLVTNMEFNTERSDDDILRDIYIYKKK